MVFTPFVASETDQNSPLDQPFFDKMRTNFDDLNDRAEALEDPGVRFFSHFNQRSGFGAIGATVSDIIVGSGDTNAILRTGGGSIYIRNQASGSGSVQEFFGSEDSAAGNNQHLIRADASTNIRAMSMLGLRYSVMSTAGALPLKFKGRFRMNAGNTWNISIGFAFWDETGNIQGPSAGIPGGVYLHRNTGTGLWRFSAHDGTAYDHGTDFTKVAQDTWFDVEILFEAGPQARCFLDGTLKQTLGDVRLPKNHVLYGHWTADVPAGTSMDCDRWLVSAAGPLPDL